jgi:hypothetical protein
MSPLQHATVWHRDRPLSPPARSLVNAIADLDRKLEDGANAPSA